MLFITFFSWSSTLTKGSMDSIDFSPKVLDFNVKWSEETYNDCEETVNNYCYVLLVENKEGYDVNYQIITKSSLGVEISDGYSLKGHESDLFVVSYSRSLGEDVEAIVEAMS